MILALCPAAAQPASIRIVPRAFRFSGISPLPAGPAPAALSSAELSEAIRAESHTIKLAIDSGFGCVVANAAGDTAYAAAVASCRQRRARTGAQDAPCESSDRDDVSEADRGWWAAKSRQLDNRASMNAYHLATADREFDFDADVARYRDRHEAGLLA